MEEDHRQVAVFLRVMAMLALLGLIVAPPLIGPIEVHWTVWLGLVSVMLGSSAEQFIRILMILTGRDGGKKGDGNGGSRGM